MIINSKYLISIILLLKAFECSVDANVEILRKFVNDTKYQSVTVLLSSKSKVPNPEPIV